MSNTTKAILIGVRKIAVSFFALKSNKQPSGANVVFEEPAADEPSPQLLYPALNFFSPDLFVQLSFDELQTVINIARDDMDFILPYIIFCSTPFLK